MKVRFMATLLAAFATVAHASEWIQQDRIDKMTDEKRTSAMLPSSNSADIGAPYGTVKAALYLGKPSGKSIDTAAFSIQRGIIECPDSCRLFVRFDNDEPVMIKALSGGGGRFTTVYFESPEDFAARLNTAKRVMIRPSIYGGNSAVFEFTQKNPLNW